MWGFHNIKTWNLFYSLFQIQHREYQCLILAKSNGILRHKNNSIIMVLLGNVLLESSIKKKLFYGWFISL